MVIHFNIRKYPIIMLYTVVITLQFGATALINVKMPEVLLSIAFIKPLQMLILCEKQKMS